MEISYQVIDTISGLENSSRTLEKEKTIAVDLEADSMYHFKEKVCLVQMATEKSTIVVDPLQVKDLSLLKPLFANPDIKRSFTGPTMTFGVFTGILKLRSIIFLTPSLRVDLWETRGQAWKLYLENI